jgi:phosphoglycolate phosphatase
LLRAVLFDLDGTLVDTPRAIVGVTQSTLAALGRPNADEQEIRDGIGLPLPQALAQLLGTGPVGATEAVEIYRTLWRAVVTPQIPRLVYPGVLEGIAELRSLGLRLAVVTGKAQEGADSTVDLMGLRSQMEVVLGYTSVARGKPAPDLAIEALRRLDLPPAQAIVVGDSTLDLEMARAASVRSIAVTYGAQPRSLLAGASFFADSFAEVVRILREAATLRG